VTVRIAQCLSTKLCTSAVAHIPKRKARMRAPVNIDLTPLAAHARGIFTKPSDVALKSIR